MPGGRRNPFSMTNIVEHFRTHQSFLNKKGHSSNSEEYYDGPYVDLCIQFIGATNLPKMDLVGSADPYFVAKFDGHLSFVSTVKQQTLSPGWNEIWRVKNVPKDKAQLEITVMDKDEGTVTDDFIGKVKISLIPGEQKVNIEGPLFRRHRGTFSLKIESQAATDADPSSFPYIFDGPIRFSRHFSPTIGRLTNLNDARLYSTWKLYIIGVPLFFGDQYQSWNKSYKAAQSIFQGPTSLAIRSGIQAGHRMLYARNTSNLFGTIENTRDIINLLHGGANPIGSPFAQLERVKPAVYTYIICAEDDSFRFSETGAAFLVDFASKHALHSNCAESVRYSGEFHPRPVGGWSHFSDDTPDDAVDWELVIDNNSGTYAPDKKMLPVLKALLEYNFSGFGIVALDHGDEELKESREACREYAVRHRGVRQDELQPHTQPGEDPLSHQALVYNQNLHTD